MRSSIEVRNVAKIGIGPKVFDVVERAKFWQEDVHDDICEVHSHPNGIVKSAHCNGFSGNLLSANVSNRMGKSLNLLWGTT